MAVHEFFFLAIRFACWLVFQYIYPDLSPVFYHYLYAVVESSGSNIRGREASSFFLPIFALSWANRHTLWFLPITSLRKIVCRREISNWSIIYLDTFLSYPSFNMLYLTILPSSMNCPLFHHNTQLHRKAWINWRTWKRIGLATLLLRLVAKKLSHGFPSESWGVSGRA